MRISSNFLTLILACAFSTPAFGEKAPAAEKGPAAERKTTDVSFDDVLVKGKYHFLMKP